MSEQVVPLFLVKDRSWPELLQRFIIRDEAPDPSGRDGSTCVTHLKGLFWSETKKKPTIFAIRRLMGRLSKGTAVEAKAALSRLLLLVEWIASDVATAELHPDLLAVYHGHRGDPPGALSPNQGVKRCALAALSEMQAAHPSLRDHEFWLWVIANDDALWGFNGLRRIDLQYSFDHLELLLESDKLPSPTDAAGAISRTLRGQFFTEI